MRLIAASELELPALVELFNAAYSDYLVALQLNEAGLGEHLNAHDIDLAGSYLVVDEVPVSFALIARRGSAGWLGGMGTGPGYRRRGLGERALMAGLENAARQRGRAIWLEVIDANKPAIRLYESPASRSCET